MRVVDLGIIVSWFAVSRGLAAAVGVEPDARIPEILWQLLPLDLLQTRLGESLWYLHSQPPLFNAFVGALLKLPGDYTAIWRALWVAIGMLFPLTVFASVSLAGANRVVAHIFTAAVCLNPTLLLYENLLFYTYPEALCVLLGLYAFLRIGRSERGWTMYGATASILTLFRATFQPAWALGVIGSTAWSFRHRVRSVRWAALLMPLLIGSALVVKNGTMFGVWSSSSWYGMNASKLMAAAMLGETDRLVTLGVVSPTFAVGPFRPVSAYPETLTQPAIDAATSAFGAVPALTAETKANGQPNFNHAAYIAISQQLAKDSLAAGRVRWALFVDTLSRGFSGFFQPASLYFLLDDNRMRVARVDEVYRKAAYPGDSRVLVHAVLLLTVLSSGVVLLCSDQSAAGWLRPAAGYVLATVVWVTLTSNLAEYGENQRFRFTLDPLMITWLGVVVTFFLCRRSKSPLRSH